MITSSCPAWKLLHITLSEDLVETVTEALMSLGALSVTFEDAEDQPIFEPMPGTSPLWKQVKISACYYDDGSIDSVVPMLSTTGLINPATVAIETLQEKRWETTWLDHFKPQCFNDRLWITSSHHPIDHPNCAVVSLDPGLAFGTGTHPTTALCLNWLSRLDLQGKCFFDIGCGSGILSIAALKLGATSAIAIDIDPQALEATRNNAQRNGLSDDQIRCYLTEPDQFPSHLSADVVIANILAAPLKKLASLITRSVNTSGLLALSGILNEQAVAVQACYTHAFSFSPIRQKEEWSLLCGNKHSEYIER